MPKKSKSGDGRRSNRPPDQHKIRSGEVRNPYGRAGKPGTVSTPEIDQIYLDQAKRVVSHDEHGEVTAGKRLVQEEFHHALTKQDAKARARVLTKLSAIQSAEDKGRRDFLEWYFDCKAKYEALFLKARTLGLPPPDVAHPSHVHYRDDHLVFTGPIDREARENWEQIKASIKIAAWLHDRARRRFKADPSEENGEELKQMEKHRRWLMRSVPQGWNWRENIYCRFSQTNFVTKTIATLERHP